MSSFNVLKLEYSACVEALADALRTEDETAFFASVDHIVHMREPGMFKELRQLTGDLQKALERFSVESRLQDIAENEIPVIFRGVGKRRIGDHPKMAAPEHIGLGLDSRSPHRRCSSACRRATNCCER